MTDGDKMTPPGTAGCVCFSTDGEVLNVKEKVSWVVSGF